MTTEVRAAEAVYLYCKRHTRAEIIIGEGCGSGTTAKVYKATGYNKLAVKYGIELVDFNNEETVELQEPDAVQLKKLLSAKNRSGCLYYIVTYLKGP